jgi:hypothetical protein
MNKPRDLGHLNLAFITLNRYAVVSLANPDDPMIMDRRKSIRAADRLCRLMSANAPGVRFVVWNSLKPWVLTPPSDL